MKTFCKLNGIEGMEKSRLIKKGVIGNQFSVDENYLRLRHFYHPFALYAYDAVVYKSDEGDDFTKAIRHVFTDKEIMFTNEALMIISAIEPEVSGMFAMRQLWAASPVLSIPAMSRGLFSGLTDIVYDTAGFTDLLRSTFNHALIDDVPESARAYISKYDLSKALSVKHPDDLRGPRNAAKLLVEQSSIIRNYRNSKIQYLSLDWRLVLAHPNFNKLQHLNTHPDNQYLKEFLIGAKDLDAAYNACVSK